MSVSLSRDLTPLACRSASTRDWPSESGPMKSFCSYAARASGTRPSWSRRCLRNASALSVFLARDLQPVRGPLFSVARQEQHDGLGGADQPGTEHGEVSCRE